MRARSIAIRAAAFIGLAGSAACVHAGAGQNSPAASTSFDYPRRQIVLTAALGAEHSGRFLLDCAVDPSVIDAKLARAMGALSNPAERREAEGAGDGKGQAITPATIRNLTIAAAAFPPIDAVAADLERFSDALGAPLSGVLGYSFFKDRVIRIDYQAKRVDIAPTAASLPPRPAPAVVHSVPLVFMAEDEFIPVIDIEAGGETLRVSLDTGSSLGVQLYETAAARLGLDPEAGERSAITGPRGSSGIVNTTLEAVSLGPFVVRNAAASLSTRRHDPAQRVGNLGNAFLENFTVTFDYVERRVTFAQD